MGAPVRLRPRHPVTGRRLSIGASSPREREAFLYRIESLRAGLRLGTCTAAEITRELRRMQLAPVSLESLAHAYVAQARLAANTRARIRGLLATHLAPLKLEPLESFDAPRVAEWLDALAGAGLEPTTIRTAWQGLSAIMSHAIARGWIEALPWGSFAPRLRGQSSRAPREAARTVAELVALLRAARALDAAAFAGGRGPGELEPLIACAALLGLRQGEIAGLRWSDVDAGPPLTVLVARQWAGDPLKGRRGPTRLETLPELGEILFSYRDRLRAAELERADGPVFPSRSASKRGDPRPYLSGEALTTLNMRAVVRLAGLPHVASWSPHSLRDSFVTLEAAHSRGDLARVQLRSRHASLASLARYLRAQHRSFPAPPAVTALVGLAGDAGRVLQ